MKNQKFLLGLMAAGIMCSCSDKKENEVIDEPKGEMEVMTPEESKSYLQNTATEVLDLFKPEDQKEIIELASYFGEEYGDLELPSNFEIEEEEYSPKSYITALGEAARGDLDGLTRASYVYTYRVDYKKFTGVYEPNMRAEEWSKTADSDDIIFRFTDKGGQRVELKVVMSGGTSEVEASFVDRWTDYYYDYDYETGEYTQEEMEETYKYFLSIPKKVTATLTQGGKELAKTVVDSNIDVDGHKLKADIEASMCNLALTANIEGNDSKVSANTIYSMNGKRIASAQAAVNGHDLCNKTKYENLADDDDDQVSNIIAGMLENGECAVDVLGKVQVYGDMTYYKEFIDDCDSYFEYPNSKEVAKSACQKVCDRLNKNINVVLRYDGTKTEQASIMFQPYLDEWDPDYVYGWEYIPEALLVFPDKTTYSIESYFEKFTNVSNKFETLLDAYEKMWDSVRK